MNLNILHQLTLEWASDRKIIQNGNVITQSLKLTEEVGELAAAALRNDKELLKDSIGDCLVVLTNIAAIAGLSLEECWQTAYNEIKDRKGILTKEGNFIKEEDLK